jgi:hypothetical protein
MGYNVSPLLDQRPRAHDLSGRVIKPLEDTIAAQLYAADDCLILFHNLASPAAATCLKHLSESGWNTLIYVTTNIMGAAWRGNINPVEHHPNPRRKRLVPVHLEEYKISGNIDLDSLKVTSKTRRDAVVYKFQDLRSQHTTLLRSFRDIQHRLVGLQSRLASYQDRIANDQTRIAGYEARIADQEQITEIKKILQERVREDLEQKVQAQERISLVEDRLASLKRQYEDRLNSLRCQQRRDAKRQIDLQRKLYATRVTEFRSLLGLMRRRIIYSPSSAISVVESIARRYQLPDKDVIRQMHWLPRRRVLLGLLRRKLTFSGSECRKIVLHELGKSRRADACSR